MEPFEFVFDYIIHLFDFIKNTHFRAFIQIVAMIIFTAVVVAILLLISKLIV